jgi:hypothetical protein
MGVVIGSLILLQGAKRLDNLLIIMLVATSHGSVIHNEEQ